MYKCDSNHAVVFDESRRDPQLRRLGKLARLLSRKLTSRFFPPQTRNLTMAKRSRSDVEIAEDPAQSHMTDGIKTKKHKVKESGGPLVDDAASKLSKEERREA